MSFEHFEGPHKRIVCRYHAGLGTGHERYRRELPFGLVYQYDPTDDGPECEIITRILAHHPHYVPGVEKRAIFLSLFTSNGLKLGKL
jgi:hypothetical protein